jgi:hypothetical protein
LVGDLSFAGAAGCARIRPRRIGCPDSERCDDQARRPELQPGERCLRNSSAARADEEMTMKFMLTFSWNPDTPQRAEAFARFRKTGGRTPQGVALLGRWTQADLSAGFDLLETDDPKKLAEFAYQWSDLMQLEIAPVLEDAEMATVLEIAGRS